MPIAAAASRTCGTARSASSGSEVTTLIAARTGQPGSGAAMPWAPMLTSLWVMT